MSTGIKHIVKQFVPPILTRLYSRQSKYGWHGHYASWQQAGQLCTGYDAAGIFEKVKEAALKVHRGQAVYERDSVLFYTEDYNWPLLSCLLLCASHNNSNLYVADFGGSLGSIYYQHKKILSELQEVKWSVIEQPHFIEFGKANLQSKQLAFYTTVKDCLLNQPPQLLLLSSVLQYLEKPLESIQELLSYKFDYILIDRTAFTKEHTHRLTIQKVNPAIYNASYPAWFFNEETFLAPFLKDYNLVTAFNNSDYSNEEGLSFKGFFLKRKEI